MVNDMQLRYWEDKAREEELRDAVPPCEQPTKEPDNIVDFTEVLQVKEEEKELEKKEIEEFLENEARKERKSNTAKYIFVDGLLGIPFLTVCYLVISAFVALMFVISVSLLALFAALTVGAVLMTGIGIAILPGRVPTALATIATGILMLAMALICLLLSALFGLKIMPWTAGLCGRLEKKLHLFRTL